MTEISEHQTPGEEQIKEALEELEGVICNHEDIVDVDDEWLDCEANSAHYASPKSRDVLRRMPEGHPSREEAADLLAEVQELETALDQRLEEAEKV